MAIGEQVVHRRQPGRPFVADPGDLNRGRFAGEDQQPVAGRVSGQVEKDVDPVRADLLRQSLVAHAEYIAPLGRGRLKTTRRVVLEDPAGVTDRLELFLAEVLQDADKEIADRVPPQIG